jgi:hypothetical protein
MLRRGFFISTSYPGSIDSFTTKQDGVDVVVAAHVNNLQDSVVAIEMGLGTTVTDGASAIGIKLDTPSYTTPGAKLLSVQNDATEKFAVDKDGKIVSGTIDESSINDGSMILPRFTGHTEKH